MSKLPIDPAAQVYHIRAAQIRAEVQAAHEAESRKLMAQEVAKAIQAAQSDNAPTRPRIKPMHSITYKKALAILERLNCPKDRKTLQRWLTGKNTPDGFTPEKMASEEAFEAWATVYARREQAKINWDRALRIDNPNNREMQRYR